MDLPGKSLVLMALALVLGACGGGDDEPLMPTPAPVETVASQPTESAGVSLSGSTASDGVCQLTIPDDWVDDGTGRGVTSLGDRWSLFGGSIAGDAGWTAAKDLLTTQIGSQSGAEIQDNGNAIRITLPNGRGLVVRQRIDNRYCEFAVTATADRAEDMTALWSSVAGTISLVARDN